MIQEGAKQNCGNGLTRGLRLICPDSVRATDGLAHYLFLKLMPSCWDGVAGELSACCPFWGTALSLPAPVRRGLLKRAVIASQVSDIPIGLTLTLWEAHL